MSAQPVVEPRGEQFGLAVETFKLLGDVTRLKILWALLHSEHSVGELASHVEAHPPAVSQQLAKLRAARLVRVRREGNRMFYAAENPHVRRLVEEALSHTDHPVGAVSTDDKVEGAARAKQGRRGA